MPETRSLVVVQIPCFNEEGTLPVTIADIRKALVHEPHFGILVIDDGSTDGTVEAARKCGADWVARMPHNYGLARAFVAGIHASLSLGANIIVNTDADNQYCADDIPKLLTPIRERRAGMVIGARPIQEIDHFSWYKKLLQRAGSATVRRLSGAAVDDAASGFRAFSRDAALRLNVFSRFSYTLETIIQAGRSGIRVVSVPVRVNAPTRPSRLFSSIPHYLRQSLASMIKVYAIYQPMQTFVLLGLVPFVLGSALAMRYVLLVALYDPSRSHAPSLILAAVLFMLAFVLWTIGILGDLVSTNRRLLEEIQAAMRQSLFRDGVQNPGQHGYELISLKNSGDDN